jgi:hypothetical protein
MDALTLGGWVTIVAAAVSTITLVVVHLTPTGVHPLRDPVSQYRHSRGRGLIIASNLGSIVAALGAIVVAIALLGPASVVTVVLLAVFALTRIGLLFFTMDAPGSAPTGTGRLHNVLAVAGFAAITAAAFTAGGALHDTGYATAATWSTALGIVAAVGAVGLLVCLTTRARLFGLFERVIYLGFLPWLLLLGATALTA